MLAAQSFRRGTRKKLAMYKVMSKHQLSSLFENDDSHSCKEVLWRALVLYLLPMPGVYVAVHCLEARRK